MEADIYLRSIATDKVQQDVVTATVGTNPHVGEREGAERLNAYYEQLAETGGYFRDPYNESSMLHAIGMDWSRDVTPLLNEKAELSIEGARHLLVEIEARPISLGMVEDVLRREGFSTHKIPGRAGLDAEGFAKHLNKRRDRLMALLRRSIELNEPLECSL